MSHVLISETLAINSNIVIRVIYIHNPSNPEINPLTTNHFFKLRYNNTITVFPVTRHTFDLPFNNIADHELEPLQQIEDLNAHNHVNVDSIINEDKFDHSELAKVDPDANFLTMNRQSTCADKNLCAVETEG